MNIESIYKIQEQKQRQNNTKDNTKQNNENFDELLQTEIEKLKEGNLDEIIENNKNMSIEQQINLMNTLNKNHHINIR